MYSAFVCIFLVATSSTGWALKCYSCNSASDPNCADAGLKTLLLDSTECPTTVATDILTFATGTKVQPVCMKFLIKDEKTQATAVHRGCGFGSPDRPDDCQKLIPGGGGAVACALCATDLCNAAPGVMTPPLLLALPLLAALRVSA